MKSMLVAAAMLAACSATQAFAQAAPQGPSMRSTDPAELPKVFAVKIATADLDRAEKFYREGLGAKHVIRIHDAERMVQFSSGLGLLLAKGKAAGEGAGGFILQVADIEAVVARIAPAGGTMVRPPNSGKGEKSFNTRAAVIRDPDGVTIELIEFPNAK